MVIFTYQHFFLFFFFYRSYFPSGKLNPFSIIQKFMRKQTLKIPLSHSYFVFHLSLYHLTFSIWDFTSFHGLYLFICQSVNKGRMRGCSRGVMVKAMDCGIVVHEFVLQSRYYVHLRANTLGKGMNALILPAMG